MSVAVRACFESCGSSVKNFCVNPKNRFSTFMGSVAGVDKTLRCLDPIFDTIGESLKAGGASADAIQGVAKARSLAKAGRDATAFFNIFNGVIAGMVQCFKTFGLLVGALFSGADEIRLKKEVKIKGTDELDPEKNKHTDVVRGKAEMVLAAIANFFKGLAAAAYAFGFGLCRPILNINKHIAKLGEGAMKLGHAFEIVMVVNHVGALVGSGSEIAFQQVARKRALSTLGMNNDVARDRIIDDCRKKTVENAVGGSEKALELIMDGVNLSGASAAMPVPARLIITLGIGVLGLYKAWLATAH